MRLIESHVKFRTYTPEEAKEMYENPLEGQCVMRGGVILEAEFWLTPEQAANPKEVEKAKHNIRQQIVNIVKQAMK